MREYKFRAWDEKEKRFWYFSLQDVLERRMNYRGSWDEKILTGEKMLYVGLKDKNGKGIYEGDIVIGINRGNDDWVFEQLVTYLKGCFMFGNWNAHEYFNHHQEIKVIGNIYEGER